jgi:hypothetical protein
MFTAMTTDVTTDMTTGMTANRTMTRQAPRAGRPVPEPDAFRAAAHSLQRQAEAKWKHAARMSNLCLLLVLVASAILAVPTGLVFVSEWEWPEWLAFPIAFALHAFLAFFVHWFVSSRKAGRAGAAAAFATGAALLMGAFFVVAILRANAMAEGGKPMWLAWTAALVYWLVECAIPIGLGVAYEGASENTADERAKAVRAQDFTRKIDAAGEDASGTWQDAEDRLEEETGAFSLRAMRFPETVMPPQRRTNEQQAQWLHELWEAHPGMRFADLKSRREGMQRESQAEGVPPPRRQASWNLPPVSPLPSSASKGRHLQEDEDRIGERMGG